MGPSGSGPNDHPSEESVMEVIVVLVAGAIVLAVLVVSIGSIGRGRRSTDELRSERGAASDPQEGMGSRPLRDRPAGPGAEAQDPTLPGAQLHPPEQQGNGPAVPPSAAGRRDPEEDERA